jgi:putative exosortase-associated protein (TIGR04073 family)
MRNATPLLVLAALGALFTAGCTGPEERLGGGINNLTEFARLGELRASVEQSAVLGSPEGGYTTGLIHGFDQSVYRTVCGAYQVVTFPAGDTLSQSSFDKKYVPQDTAYPDSYRPDLINDTTFQTDTYFGFSGGDVAPFVPGSRFSVFPNSN